MQLANGLIVRPSECHIQARYNADSAAYRHLGLKLIAGSLGVGTNDKPMYIFGNPTWKDDVQQFYTTDGWLNAHIWLEDDKARVYDIQLPFWQVFADAGKKLLSTDARLREDEHYRLIEAKTKDELRLQGFHYTACAQHLHEDLLDAFFSTRIEILNQ